MNKNLRALDRAWFYEHLHTGNPGDLEFYERATRGSTNVLELGSGTGRLASRLGKSVENYVGLEIDPSLAERSLALVPNDVRFRIEIADMTKFAVPERFERIILPYNALYCVGGREGARETFRRVAEHLAQDGEFWLDVYFIDAYHEALMSGEAPRETEPPEVVLETEFEGVLLVVSETTEVHPEEQRLVVRYEARAGKEVLGEETLVHDYLVVPELLLLLEESGLEVDLLLGDFDGAPFDDDAGHLILCASRRK